MSSTITVRPRTAEADVEAGIELEEKSKASSNVSDYYYVGWVAVRTPRQVPSCLMLPPERQVKIEFKNVGKSVLVPGATQPVNTLWGISGEALPGQILAVMGPAQAGNTTFLDIMAHRSGAGVHGRVKWNGQQLDKCHTKDIGYVLQADFFWERHTVKQQLEFTATLKLGQSVSVEEKAAAVQYVIDTMSLTYVADTPIFLLSVGQRKRMAIAVELMNNPSLLVLDEPFTGLDPTSAYTLALTLRELAAQGRTLICSTRHCPGRVFWCFDQVLLLAAGNSVFCASPYLLDGYLTSLGYPCPLAQALIDHAMDLLSGNIFARDYLIQTHIKMFPRTHGEGEGEEDAHAEAEAAVAKLTAEEVERRGASQRRYLGHSASQFEADFVTQFWVLYKRHVRAAFQDIVTRWTFFQCMMMCLIASLSWWNMGNAESDLSDRSSFAFFTLTFWGFQAVYESLPTLPTERFIVNRERATNTYRLSAYFLARTVAELPFRFILPCLYVSITYWTTSVNPSSLSYGGWLWVVWMAVICGESLGMFVGSLVGAVQRAVILANVTIFGLMIVGGFYVRKLPNFFSWAKYASFLKYGYDSFLAFQFTDDITFRCEGGVWSTSCVAYVQNNRLVTPTTLYSGDIRHSLNITLSNTGNFFVLVGFFCFFKVLTYIALRNLHTKTHIK